MKRSSATLSTAMRRGVTLVELLVTIATLVVVLGLALAVAGETEHATRRIVRFQRALQYCQQAMDQVTGAIRAAVDPTALAGLRNQTILAPHFRERELELFVYDSIDGALTQVRLHQTTEDEKVVLRRDAGTVSETAGGRQMKKPNDKLGGPSDEDFTPSLRFRYAAGAQPGKPPEYKNEWTQAGLPALIQVTIEARFDDDRDGVIVLQTAEIPGMLAATLPIDAAAAAEPATPGPAGQPAPATDAITSETATTTTPAAATPAGNVEGAVP